MLGFFGVRKSASISFQSQFSAPSRSIEISRSSLWVAGLLGAFLEGVRGIVEEHEAGRLNFGGCSGWGAESSPESKLFMKASSSAISNIT